MSAVLINSGKLLSIENDNWKLNFENGYIIFYGSIIENDYWISKENVMNYKIKYLNKIHTQIYKNQIMNKNIDYIVIDNDINQGSITLFSNNNYFQIDFIYKGSLSNGKLTFYSTLNNLTDMSYID